MQAKPLTASTIAVDDHSLSFLRTMNAEAHTLLFLHGFMGCAADWQAVMPALSPRFDCVAVDLPGHGKTRIGGGEAAYRMENCAALLLAFLQKLKIRTCSLIGYSMGGRLALYLAVNHPRHFRALILESASPGLRTAAERTRRMAEDEARAVRLESSDFRDFLKIWYQLPLFANLTRHAGFEALFARRLQNDPAGLAASLRHMGTGRQPSLWRHLANLTLPVLLLAGERDQKFVRLNRQMATACPSAQLQIIEGAGHTIHFEKPALFIDKIQQFFNKIGERK